MNQSGITIEGNTVFAGVFKFVGTHGLPLEVILHKFKENNHVVDWCDYILMALKDGHNPKTIKSNIIAAVGDVYGPRYCEEITTRLNKLLH